MARDAARTVSSEIFQKDHPDTYNSGPKGSLAFVLHSHIPYCRKAGMWPFGEEWLYEAMLESYLPLLDLLRSISDQVSSSSGTPGGRQIAGRPSAFITIGITPILLDQLDDDYMRRAFLQWTEVRLARANHDRRRFRLDGDRLRERQAAAYCERYGRAIEAFRREYSYDIAGAFGELQDRGVVEIITSAATHAYLPLLKEDTSIRAQLAAGCESYMRRFGRAPRGIWLPECAYRPGLEEYLQSLGLEYFFVDRHAVEGGEPIGISSGSISMRSSESRRISGGERSGSDMASSRDSASLHGAGPLAKTTFEPYFVGASKVACFGRNERVTTQVWSSWLGYPGDGVYREFHKKDDVSGLQYWRVTSRDTDLGAKELYDVEAASARCREHAAHFVGLVHELVADWWDNSGKHGVIVAPYDTELFGHWWYEGVDWLGDVIRGLLTSAEVAAKSVGQVLDEHPPKEAIEVPESSWGRGGKHDVWLNEGTAWMWDRIWVAEARIKRLAVKCQAARLVARESRDGAVGPLIGVDANMISSDLLEALKVQALREFFLLTASDWPFLVTERQATEYGAKRFREHTDRFDRLMDYAERLLAGELEEKERAGAERYLEEVREVDDPFPWLDFSLLESPIES
ncbi:MAG: DUF1957 domain-containing protein [Firmicutes bacterium]|nr:DUF1957 domain-containing protein [Bacillota bacterium]